MIVGLLGVILLGFLYDTLRIGFDAGAAAKGFVPQLRTAPTRILLATGILGATVMPHVIYLHSALTQDRIPPRDDGERRRLLRFQRIDVIDRDGARRARQHVDADHRRVAVPRLRADRRRHDRGRARAASSTLVGAGAALAFALALLASGLASLERRHVRRPGRHAGLHRPHDPARRCAARVTMTPALIVLAIGVDPTRALVLSQVVLSFGIPFALVPLVLLTRRRDVMGSLVNRATTTVVACVVAALIIALNAVPDLRHDLRLTPSSLPPPVRADDRLAETFQRDRRLAARRLDGPRARPADLRRGALRRGRDLPRHLQRAAVLAATTGTGGCSSRIASATPPRRRAVHGALKLLDDAGIDGELALREMRSGRVEVVADVGTAGVRARRSSAAFARSDGGRLARRHRREHRLDVGRAPDDAVARGPRGPAPQLAAIEHADVATGADEA